MLIDPQIFTSQVRGGISRYFVELIKQERVFREYGISLRIPYRYVVNEHAAADLPRRFAMLPQCTSREARLLRTVRAKQQRFRRADVVHHTYYDPDYFDLRHRPRRICTVYDMIPEKFPEQFPHGNPHMAKARFLANSDRIIAISEVTKRDLVEIYSVAPERVQVIPLAVGAQFAAPVGPTDRRREILFVGGRGGYKNFECLLQAFAMLPERLANVRLTAVGAPFTESETVAIDGAGLADRVVSLSLSDADLAERYQRALAFVFPSAYEGFGLPVLEAMASGCPALLSHGGSLHEVGGEAARYFAPDAPADLTRLLTEVLDDESMRRDMAAAGLDRVRQFSWTRTAQATAEIYATV